MPTSLPGARTHARLAWATLAGLVLLTLVVHRVGAGRPAAAVAFSYLTVACVVAWAAALSYGDGVPLRALVGPVPRERRMWAWVALAVPLLVFSLTTLLGALYLLSWVAPAFVAGVLLGPDDPALLAGRPLYLALDVAAATVFGPMAEEVLFRGALLRRWSGRWGPRWGMVASAALFAALHEAALGAFVFGVCMALLARHAGGLLVPMAAHVAHNALLQAGERLAPGGDPVGTLAEFRAEAWPVALAAVPATLLLLWLVRRLGDRVAPAVAPAS
jgi:membrane protease YdiL (CAAX protease family)